MMPSCNVWTKGNKSARRYQKVTLRIWESEVCATQADGTGKPGRVMTDGKHLTVQCGESALAIKKLQLPGKNILEVQDFLNGHDMEEGSCLPSR